MGIPRSARKLNIHGEEWRWKTNGHYVDVWSPEEEMHSFSAITAFGQWNKECDCCGWESGVPIEPGMIRKYIEENFMDQTPEYVPETPDVGKLYVYRRPEVKQGASITIESIKGGIYESGERYKMLFAAFQRKDPLFLVSFRTDVQTRTSKAKFLVGDILVDINIEYPRTFRASFLRYYDWRSLQEEEASER